MPRPVRDFDSMYERRGSDECWPWSGGLRNGYGRYCLGGGAVSAPRFAWERANGPIPPGKQVLHTCDHKPCVNPGHLYVGTIADNARDREERGRRRKLLGEEQPQSLLTDAQVLAIRADYAARGSAQRGRRGSVTYETLGRQYGIAGRTVGKIVRRESWKHL